MFFLPAYSDLIMMKLDNRVEMMILTICHYVKFGRKFFLISSLKALFKHLDELWLFWDMRVLWFIILFEAHC